MRKIILSILLSIATLVYAAPDVPPAEKLDVEKTQAQIRSLKQDKKLDQAAELAKQYLAQYPRDVDVQILLASIYYQQKDYNAAKDLLEDAKKNYPNDPDVEGLLASVNMLIKNRNTLGTHLDKIDADIKEKDYAEAMDITNIALKQYPNNPELLKRQQKIKYLTTQKTIAESAAAGAGTGPGPSGAEQVARSATVFAPSNLQATNVLNAVVSDYAAQKYGPNQMGINQQSIYGTSPDGYWDYTNLYYVRTTDFGMVLGSLNYASRFGYHSYQGAAEAILNFSKTFYLDLNLAYATNLNLFPNWTVGAEGYISFPSSIQISFGDLYRAIDPKYFNTYTVSIQKDIGDYSLIFRPYIYVPQFGEDSTLFTATARRYFDSSDHFIGVTIGYGITPDLNDLQSIDFITVKDRSIAGIYQFPVWDHRLVIDVGLSYENQRFPTGFIRQLTGADVGFRARF